VRQFFQFVDKQHMLGSLTRALLLLATAAFAVANHGTDDYAGTTRRMGGPSRTLDQNPAACLGHEERPPGAGVL
jgi:hypothetical protein